MFRSSCLRPFCIRFSLLLMQNKGPFCIDLGSFLVPFWCHGALRGAFREFSQKNLPKNASTWGAFGRPLGPFGRLLGSIWAALGCHCDPSVAKMAPTSVQNLEKSRSKHALRYRICFCIDFLLTFVPRPGAPNHQNHGNLIRFTVFQRLKRFPLELCFGFDFGFKNGAFWHPFDDFLGAFGSILGHGNSKKSTRAPSRRHM